MQYVPKNDDKSGQSAENSNAQPTQMKKLVGGVSGYEAQAAALSPVQMHGGGGNEAQVHELAAQGTSGSGGALPHSDAIQASFGGYDVGGITAHTGAEAQQSARAMGAEAYATGSNVAFAGAPSLHTTAHEAAHIIQQSAGVSLSGGVGQEGDRYENHADRVADAVVSGRSAEPILHEMTGGSAGGAVQAKAVQRYEDKSVAGQQLRVSDDGKVATDVYQVLYATKDLIDDSNKKLTKVGQHGSFIQLVGNAAATVSTGSHTLQAVAPQWIPKGSRTGHSGLDDANKTDGKDSEGTKGDTMALWSDCGRSSRSVMGTDTAPRGVVSDAGGNKLITGASYNPGKWTHAVYSRLVPEFMKLPSSAQYLQEGVHYTESGGSRTILTPKDGVDAKRMYWELGEKGRLAFDEMAGMNYHADPEVGGGYTMATEYDMPGSAKIPGKMRWNFHWGGVVMKAGSDNITLENYAVTGEYAESMGVKQYDFSNREWNFAMYGTKKTEQTFHHEHLATGTHGTRASTFAVRSDKK